MDQQQIGHFKNLYSRMSDEELAYLVATRAAGLSEEASQALQTVLASRDSTAFQKELSATASDVTAQLSYETQEAEKKLSRARARKKVIRFVCAVLLLIGLAGLVVGSEFGKVLGAIGVICLIHFELRNLLGRFVVALFRAN